MLDKVWWEGFSVFEVKSVLKFERSWYGGKFCVIDE